MMDPYYLDLQEIAPTNVAAEASILGVILVENERLAEVRKVLLADDFSRDSHKRIFLRMCEMADAKTPIDLVTLSEYMFRKCKDDIGETGVAYLAGLTEGIFRRMNIAEYIAIVREKSLLRQIMRICENGYRLSSQQSVESKEIGREIVKELTKLFRDKK